MQAARACSCAAICSFAAITSPRLGLPMVRRVCSVALEFLLTCVAAEHGDRPRPLPDVKELKSVTEVFECKGQKWWDFDPVKKEWGWTRPPPESQKPTGEVRGRC